LADDIFELHFVGGWLLTAINNQRIKLTILKPNHPKEKKRVEGNGREAHSRREVPTASYRD